jgi:DNA repair protein RecN (Recombination protein N)
VLTGETGAGKSILIDAVSIGLGARFDARLMHHQASICEITLCFDLSHALDAKNYLKAQQLESDNECIIRRLFTKDGRSKCTFNDTPCTVQFVRQVGQYLVSFYGQHAHQALLKSKIQRLCLDRFADQMEQCANIKILYEKHMHLTKRLSALKERNKTAAVQKDYLEHQLAELEALDLKSGLWETLSKQHQRYLQIQNNREGLNKLQGLLTETEPNILTLLNQALCITDRMADPSFENIKQLLTTAEVHVQEAILDLQRYNADNDLNQEGFEQLDQKISTIYHLARKHNVEPAKLWQATLQLRAQKDELNGLDAEIEVLANTYKNLLNEYDGLASMLSRQRKNAAEKLSRRITEQLQQLGMKGAVFDVQLIEREEKIHAEGQEKVIFRVRTNPGQPLMLMQKIISGGELSRLGLALQVAAQDNQSYQTLIFDEVDTGIGGQTAQIVGELLRQLATSTQVLCITHLPQIASRAKSHFNVVKRVEKEDTSATIRLLNRDERIKELARMSTGGKMTDTLLRHAEALLAETE